MPVGSGHLLDVEFDFISHEPVFRKSVGETRTLSLQQISVADFFSEYLRALAALRVETEIDPMPVEVPNPIRFDRDTVHASYDKDAVARFWRTLILADTLFKRFSTCFYGKISPVHFFWGSFDLAVTRFNGEKAPPRPGEVAAENFAFVACLGKGKRNAHNSRQNHAQDCLDGWYKILGHKSRASWDV